MSSATLNLRVQDQRMMSAKAAAYYCGLPVKSFAASCPCNPVKIGNDERYDKKALDKWLDGLSSGASDYERITAALDAGRQNKRVSDIQRSARQTAMLSS